LGKEQEEKERVVTVPGGKQIYQLKANGTTFPSNIPHNMDEASVFPAHWSDEDRVPRWNIEKRLTVQM
jgi:hypothetical protein